MVEGQAAHEWRADESPGEVLRALNSDMVVAGMGPDRTRVRLDIALGFLRDGLKEAVAARRGLETWLPATRLLEVITQDVILTANGIARRGSDGELAGMWGKDSWSLGEAPADFRVGRVPEEWIHQYGPYGVHNAIWALATMRAITHASGAQWII
jgi:hypothetical protein